MIDINDLEDRVSKAIEKSGYMIESRHCRGTEEPVFNISFYDAKHIAKYSYALKIDDVDAYIKLSTVFLSGIDEDKNGGIQGSRGPIVIENIGPSKECRIKYEFSIGLDEYMRCDISTILKELEDSIYRVRYRKYFAL